MGSFPSQAERVRDEARPLGSRLWQLRGCALSFAPYGFRATWHHLVVNARIPAQLEADPASLLRAVDELERARHLWRVQFEEYAARRRTEKQHGQRTPREQDWWRDRPPLFCPDPEQHPREDLAIVIGRLVRTLSTEEPPPDICVNCGAHRRLTRVCGACGVAARHWHRTFPGRRIEDSSGQWHRIWQRLLLPEC